MSEENMIDSRDDPKLHLGICSTCGAMTYKGECFAKCAVLRKRAATLSNEAKMALGVLVGWLLLGVIGAILCLWPVGGR